MNPLKGKAKILATVSIVLIIVISYSLFFYLQSTNETNTRNGIFEQQKALQMRSTQALSQRISSDMSFMMAKLQGLADSTYLQQGDLSSDKTKKLSQEIYAQINNVTTSDRFFIINKNCIVMTDIELQGQKSFIGTNVSGISWIQEITFTHKPVFSNGYNALDGRYRVAVSYPIINRETGEYHGLVGFSVPTVQLFEHYGNIFDIKSQYLAVLDRDSDQLIHPVKSFVGTPFFGSYTQQVTGHNNILNGLIRTVMEGKPNFAVYNFKNGDRLNTGFPILLDGQPTYFVFIITPMSVIYSQMDKTMSTERMEMFSLLVGMTAAIVLLVIFLIRWSSTLDSEVKRRTMELETANKQLSVSNEQLKMRDKAQQEFVNVAAHELRTPIQPIISLSDSLLHRIRDDESRELIHTIFRSAKRLQRLSQDILDVTRIESGLMNLNKQRFDLNEVISCTIDDYRNQIKNSKRNIRLAYGFDRKEETEQKGEKGREVQEQLHNQLPIQGSDNIIPVEADKGRIAQVIDNLLNNALKFTNEGTISVSVESKDGQAIVSVKDNGQGIDPEILPKLFTKFASKSETGGTGLGLFISKSIIEAHGGKIWAENNSDGKGGAAFSFSLPL
ncbi:MAG: ATP-binding protein [Nitrososphaeraceae archaeon]|jgi:signal transduction histidine kinase